MADFIAALVEIAAAPVAAAQRHGQADFRVLALVLQPHAQVNLAAHGHFRVEPAGAVSQSLLHAGILRCAA